VVVFHELGARFGCMVVDRLLFFVGVLIWSERMRKKDGCIFGVLI
jgi:hypothetical protein